MCFLEQTNHKIFKLGKNIIFYDLRIPIYDTFPLTNIIK